MASTWAVDFTHIVSFLFNLYFFFVDKYKRLHEHNAESLRMVAELIMKVGLTAQLC